LLLQPHLLSPRPARWTPQLLSPKPAGWTPQLLKPEIQVWSNHTSLLHISLKLSSSISCQCQPECVWQWLHNDRPQCRIYLLCRI
jgi:hypothetical protein